MDSSPQHCDVAIIGGGVIGLACAWELAAQGRSVVVCDPAPAAGASRTAGGMLPPATESDFGEEAILGLNQASAERWPAFAERLEAAADQTIGYHRSGALVVARDPDEAAQLDRLASLHERLGLPSRRVRSREARRLEPRLSPRTRGALVCDGDDRVDNRALLEALHRAGEAAGVALIRERVQAVESDGDAVAGVRLADGRRLGAAHVVLAAGWRSGEVEGVPLPVPVRPVKGQILHLRAREGDPPPLAGERFVRGLGFYLVPRGERRLVVGATMEERDQDTAITAGAVLKLLRDAWEVLPDVGELELVETDAALRPATPDNGPLLGHGGLDGLILACGHWRNGIALTPVTTAAVRALVEGQRPPEATAPFAPARFAPTPA